METISKATQDNQIQQSHVLVNYANSTNFSKAIISSSSSTLDFLTHFHAGYFRISLSLSSQALLWKVLSGPTTSGKLHSVATRLLPSSAFIFLWSLSLLSLLSLSLLYSLRCLLRFNSIRNEFSHHVGVNYLFTPWISSLLLLQSNPFHTLHPKTHAYTILFWACTTPILVLDIKIYGQWFTKGRY